jgi:hypothetical protein
MTADCITVLRITDAAIAGCIVLLYILALVAGSMYITCSKYSSVSSATISFFFGHLLRHLGPGVQAGRDSPFGAASIIFKGKYSTSPRL